ncbi:MAG: enoyl-CoA hydratase [Alteromonadaceae bacterium]|nr:enoyl-CoA hydratase [Alteromonadaceae bacterium]MBL6704000.1 crotonase/enoyl-CoA hydratase family protein [Pseudomonadales bacterium]MBL6824127.1 crotonase/enoyl-CoA hydratase family protein [Luminiphilus sp.]RPH08769.1 MAG: crotonase/enoyl-CoA hydratase family protein [Alteromonadaceae bacterium TMED101]
MNDRVLMSTEEGVCHVRLNRPDKMNALDPAMFDGITAALAALARDTSIRVIVLSGEGKAFCAGLDLGSFGLSDDAPTDLVPRTHGKANGVQHLGWGWRQLPVPVISALHGVCLGGGMQLMAGSDIKIIHPETRCAVMEMRWGLVPDMSGYPLWRGNVRDDILRRLVYTNEMFSGVEAQDFGFATEVSEDPLSRAMALAHEIAGKNPEAIRAAKRISNSMADATDAELLLAESVEQTEIIYKPNQLEAVAAYFEKRAANFK